MYIIDQDEDGEQYFVSYLIYIIWSYKVQNCSFSSANALSPLYQVLIKKKLDFLALEIAVFHWAINIHDFI